MIIILSDTCMVMQLALSGKHTGTRDTICPLDVKMTGHFWVVRRGWDTESATQVARTARMLAWSGQDLRITGAGHG